MDTIRFITVFVLVWSCLMLAAFGMEPNADYARGVTVALYVFGGSIASLHPWHMAFSNGQWFERTRRHMMLRATLIVGSSAVTTGIFKTSPADAAGIAAMGLGMIAVVAIVLSASNRRLHPQQARFDSFSSF